MILIKKHSILIFSLALFILLLPLSDKINFVQNDDWNRTLTTLEFIKGNFTLRPETANTFYLQGLIGSFFYHLTKSTKFPLLTLLFSVLNFYVFTRIVKDFYKRSDFESILMGLILFLNPLHIYSIWGFMAENFFLFFMLLSLYFFHRSEEKKDYSNLIISCLLSILGFFVKQVSLVTILTYAVFLLFKKDYKRAFLSAVMLFTTVLFYYLIFPRTPEMHYKDLGFNRFLNIQYLYSLTWANINYLVAFTIPLVISLLLKLDKTKKNLLIIIFISIIHIPIIYFFFRPSHIWSGIFPYLQNVFMIKGFHTLNIGGLIYSYKGAYDLFSIWQWIAMILSVILVGVLLANIKRLNHFGFFYTIFSLGLMLLVMYMYDRYLLPIYPVLILLFLHLIKVFNKVDKLIILGFIIFLAMLNYQFSMDYVLSTNYLYSKSQELIDSGVNPEDIESNRAWDKITTSKSGRHYIFSYDKPRNSDVLIEKHKVEYPLNIHIDPYIYLVKRDNL